MAFMLVLFKDADGIGDVLPSCQLVLLVIWCVYAEVVNQFSDYLVAAVGAGQDHLTHGVIMVHLLDLFLILKLLHLQLFYLLYFVPSTHGNSRIVIAFCLFWLNLCIEVDCRWKLLNRLGALRFQTMQSSIIALCCRRCSALIMSQGRM